MYKKQNFSFFLVFFCISNKTKKVSVQVRKNMFAKLQIKFKNILFCKLGVIKIYIIFR